MGVNSFTPLAVGGVLGHPTSAGGVLDYAKGNISQRDFFKLADTSGGLKGHTLKLFKPRNNTTVWRNFFSSTVVNEWNRLPKAPSVNAFKNKTGQILERQALREKFTTQFIWAFIADRLLSSSYYEYK